MSEPGHWFERNPLWFKTAIFYERSEEHTSELQSPDTISYAVFA